MADPKVHTGVPGIRRQETSTVAGKTRYRYKSVLIERAKRETPESFRERAEELTLEEGKRGWDMRFAILPDGHQFIVFTKRERR